MNKLAINGGETAVTSGMVAWPALTEEDKRAVIAVLEKGELWGAFAPEVEALQQEWAEWVGTKYALTTNSGTAALHIALAAAGVGPGDEVISTACTFVAVAHAVMHCNAVPVFVDIDPKTFNIDASKIEEKITKRTRAIVPVHLHGMPADMDEINAIAKKHHLLVIEDACQAHGALYKGRNAGSLADMAAFSMNGTKNLPGAEGGLFNTDSDEFYRQANRVRFTGEDPPAPGVERRFNATAIGWMYRYQEMPAALARSILRRLHADNETRRQNAAYLSQQLSELPGVIPPYVPQDRTSVFHLYRIMLDPAALGLDVAAKVFRAKVQKAIRAEGVQANRWQTMPVPAQDLFQQRVGYGKGCPWSCPFRNGAPPVTYSPEDYPVSRKVLDESIVMRDALYPPNGKQLLDQYVAAFHKLWENIDQVLEVSFEPDEIYLAG